MASAAATASGSAQCPFPGMFGFPFPRLHLAPSITHQTTKHIVQTWMHPFNELADEYFYNVSEEDKLAVQDDAHGPKAVVAGSIVYVAPGRPPLFFEDVYAFLQDKRCSQARALCVPGVGSSVLGAIGLARDVAHARKVPVAGVVAGYGLRELVNDAWGGAVCFRETNELEFLLENTRRSLATTVAGMDLLPTLETYDSLGGGPAIQAVKALLRDGRMKSLEFAVGHSKGNMVLSGALSELFCEDADIRALQKVTIVLLSAICTLPEKVGKRQVQIIGALDPLGWANSQVGIPATRVVPNAAHHLNAKYPFFLDAVSLLKSL